ncbi:uncharacterized protein RJT20DRAFT_33609 [Scheffersomyces xylosifermentans]|uniref:uncharacterized protein n=1 Tax=Scheffersomyces xylosifermentans TaxID=1304137 RepID=UPI00315DF6BC
MSNTDSLATITTMSQSDSIGMSKGNKTRVGAGSDGAKQKFSGSRNNKNPNGSLPSAKNQKKAIQMDNSYRSDTFQNQIESQIKQNKRVSGRSRKNQISINHLLDFQSYRDSDEYHVNHTKNNNNNKPRRGSGTRSRNNLSSKVNLRGMGFINVNYKFVVDHRKNYRVQEMDPNVPVDTEDIVRIIVPKGNACPICLTDEPIAPRMITSCGHIICLKCVLSLLESEVPNAKKRESSAIVEKYRECPLCSSIIRKNELKPVLINNIDENLETPKIQDEVVLSLMARPQSRIFPLPKPLVQYFDSIDHFPWVNQTNPDCNQFSRIFKGETSYLLNMYEFEKQHVKANYEEEKLLYGEDDKFVKMALKHIDNEISSWITKLGEDLKEKDVSPGLNLHSQVNAPLSSSPNLTVDDGHCYFYYQTGFNSSVTFVLSPLDMKVLKTAYNNSYTSLPSSIIAKIENIKYEYLTTETSLTKYKYLSHLPLGSQIGFIECNWNHNEFITREAWDIFKDDLTKRTKSSTQKLKREERNRRRALNEEEIKTRNFYIRENSGRDDLDDSSYVDYAAMGSLSITDNRELPALSDHQASNNEHSSASAGESAGEHEMTTTIWGTKIPKAEVQEEEPDEDDWDAEEMIRKAREEMERQENESGKGRKKKKKKMILISSNSNW